MNLKKLGADLLANLPAREDFVESYRKLPHVILHCSQLTCQKFGIFFIASFSSPNNLGCGSPNLSEQIFIPTDAMQRT